MTIREYLEANHQEIFKRCSAPTHQASGYVAIGLIINKMGQLDWTAHWTDVFHEAGIYKRTGQGAVLTFASIPMSFFTNVCPESGTATAVDLIDELYYENWNQVQSFSTLVEAIQHYYSMIDDLPTNRSHPLCW
tara:strand:+ start:573 stop:974 length:402 start_codon:yes stop_codon:yes gene_type:complete